MRSLFLFFASIFIFALSQSVAAQTHRHLKQEHQLTSYEDLSTWLDRAHWMREHILISNGLWPMPEKTPLNPTLSDITAEDGYRVQTVTLETYPGFYLTGTLFLPPGEGPFPAILSAHGHWSEGRFEDIDRASIPGRALNFAKRGFAVFSYSMIGYNETAGLFPHRFDDPQYQLWGFSAMGLQLWNSIRALDYLSSRPEVDPDRIGMTGASGGGTQTFLLTAIDERIKAAAPVNMISAHFQGGCICENAPLLRQDINNVEIAALTAPRPLLMVSTSGDWTVNTPSIEFPAVQKIYALFDAEDRVENAHFDFPHNYNKDTRESVYPWFEQWLGVESGLITEAAFTLPPSTTMNARLPEAPTSEKEAFHIFVSQATDQFPSTAPASRDELNMFINTYGTVLDHTLYSNSSDFPLDDITFSSPGTQSSIGMLIVHESTQESHNRARFLSDSLASLGSTTAQLALHFEEDLYVTPDSISYWTTYNPTHTQHQVHQIIHAAESLFEYPHVVALDLIGIDRAGALTLLARTQYPFIRNTRIDFNGIAYDTDQAYLKHANIPLFRRAGGFKTAAAMAAPAPLAIQNLPDGELKSWIRQLYNELGADNMLSFE